MNRGMQAGMARAKTTLAGFTPGQRGVVAVAVVALVLAAFALTRWVAQPAWGPLYGNLEGTDASAIVEELQAQGVQYQLSDGGSTVLVPQSQVYALRVSMSGKGLPAAAGGSGYSILDKQGITATDFQQNIAYRRALEGELANTLGAIDGVRTAVVHLALPKKDVFATEADKATASVLVSLQPGVQLDKPQVLAMTHLVAGSVEGLSPDDVTVTDSAGRMLSATGVGGVGAGAADSAGETAQYEERLGGAVQDMLDQVLGTGNSVVRVNARLNYDASDSTTERYLNEVVPPLSEATVKESYTGDGAGAGGALGQIAPDPAAAADGAGTYARDQRTVNNAVGKVVERVQSAPGSVDRLTVAVVLDAKTAGTADPNMVSQLVANAVGLDPARGDSVQVQKMPFDTTTSEAAAKELAAAEAAAKTAGYIDLGKQAGIALLVLIAGVVMLIRRRKAAKVEATASDLPYPPEGYYLPQPMAALEQGEQAALPSASDVERERDKMRESVAALVDNQPEDVASVIQGWLNERQGA